MFEICSPFVLASIIFSSIMFKQKFHHFFLRLNAKNRGIVKIINILTLWLEWVSSYSVSAIQRRLRRTTSMFYFGVTLTSLSFLPSESRKIFYSSLFKFLRQIPVRESFISPIFLLNSLLLDSLLLKFDCFLQTLRFDGKQFQHLSFYRLSKLEK